MKNKNIPSSEIFGAYDIRGIVGKTLNEDIVYELGLAIGSESQARSEKKIFIARDGRLSGPLLSKALARGLMDSGCDVVDLGSIPTPLLYFATHHLDATSGVMLTGSHNPPDYNGLKIIIAGETLADQAIQNLYQRCQQQNYCHGSGTFSESDVVPHYFQMIKETVAIKKPFNVVVDAGNGISGNIAPRLLRELGCNVIEIFCEVDGTFPNHHPDPSVIANLQDLIASVRQHNADLGLAFDGDGDRLGVVTEQGEIIFPDRLLMLLAQEVLENNPGAAIVYDVKCSSHLENVLKKQGGNPVMWKTGHSLIKSKMREVNALLAGEMSGHIFYKDKWYGFDDGIYSAVRLLALLSNQSQSSAAKFSELPNSINTPEIKINVPHEKKFSLVETFANNIDFEYTNIITIDGVRIEFSDGWGLLRASNTTPCLVLRFEADDQQALERIKNKFRYNLQKLISKEDILF